TDDRGWFQIEGPAGDATYTLEVVLHGYNPESQKIRVRDGKVSRVRFRLTKDIYANYRTVIREPRIPKEVTKKKISAAEIQKIPGNSGDALKVVQLLPGVARGSFGSGDPVVRGSGPEDTRIFLEGQEMPFLFHFGGIYSVINTDLLASVDFWPGGFGPEYGLATGGAVEVRLRPLQTDRWHGLIETNAFHSSVLVEGPVGEKTAVAFGVRRSYVDAVLKAVVPADVLAFTVAPRYYDYQFRLTHEFNPRHRFSFFWYGADDALEIFIDEPSGRDGIFAGRLSTDFEFHLGTAKWDWDIRPDLRLETTARVGLVSIEFLLGIFELDLDIKPLDLRNQLDWEITRDLNLTVGMQTTGYIFSIDYFGPLPPKEGEPQSPPDVDDFRSQRIEGEPGVGLAPYIEMNWRIADQLTLSPGFRTDTIIGQGYGYTSFDPRFAFRWDVLKGTAIKGFWGIYHKPPEGDEWDDQIGNEDLGPEESMSVSVGAEQKILDHLTVDLQLFQKWMSDLIVPADEEVDGASLLNRGQGRVKGLELMLRHQSSERFFGWLTYTLMKAERQDEIDGPWRPFDFDQTHILNLVGVVRLPRGWEVGLRFRYTTGNPYAPVVGAVYDADGDTYLPTYGAPNSARVADFHQLDLRVDKKFVFDDWLLDVFLEVQNVYLQPNPEGIAYNNDFTRSRPITGIPIFPNIGVKADF
ncbi:MAG: TonB-dependent receptor, partial [Myxococcota bacterium]|nr:TonB-dependent receptor [Myxococcota bacterium]